MAAVVDEKNQLHPQAIEQMDTYCIATYAQQYGDAMHNPYHDNYAPILQSFIAGPNINIQPAQLLEQVLGNTQIPQAFLILLNSAMMGYPITQFISPQDM